MAAVDRRSRSGRWLFRGGTVLHTVAEGRGEAATQRLFTVDTFADAGTTDLVVSPLGPESDHVLDVAREVGSATMAA